MEQSMKYFVLIFGIIILVFFITVGTIIYFVNRSLNYEYSLCESVGILKSHCGITMTVQCLSDCRILGHKEFRWNNQGFGGDTCWCLDKENKSIQIW